MSVELSEEMLNCDISFVTFELKDGTVYECLVANGKADIPEVKEPQFVKIGVYSSDIENDKCVKRYSPHPANVYVNNGSYSGNGTEAPTPTAGTFEELLETINEVDEKTIKTLESVKVWELEAGVYFVTDTVQYATENPTEGYYLGLDGVQSTLLVSRATKTKHRYFILFTRRKIWFGHSLPATFGGTGECHQAVADVCEEITDKSGNEFTTAKAVYDYVQSVLPPSAEEVEY
jgi:hypothetical protein